eukprot:14717-Rhodomonas_salina.2
MVLVMRSGMEMRRFDPMCLSLRKPDTAMRPLYSVSHRISHSSCRQPNARSAPPSSNFNLSITRSRIQHPGD